MSEFSYSVEFISIGSNRFSNCMDWLQCDVYEKGLLAYGAGKYIALYDPKVCKIIRTLNGFKGEVTTLSWFKTQMNNSVKEEECYCLCGGDNEGIIQIFNFDNEWINTLRYGSNSTICSVDSNPFGFTVINSNKQLFLYSSCTAVTTDEQKPLFTTELSLKTKVNCIKSININDNECLMFMGCVNSNIYIYSYRKDNNKFELLNYLEGSEDWIRCISICCIDDNNYYISSGSQDNKIRIYKMKRITKTSEEEEEEDRDTKIITCETTKFLINLESVLYGHNDWITGLELIYNQNPNGKNYPVLYSCSMDKTIQIWHPESIESKTNTIVWSNEDILGNSNSHSLGYYNIKVLYKNEELEIITSDYKGQFNYYKREKDEDIYSYISLPIISGHTNCVTDISWSNNYSYFISCSKDMTSRLFSKVNFKDYNNCYFELARPQIHGYPINTLTTLNNYKYISGSDEKMLREFIAPQRFIELYSLVKERDIKSEIDDYTDRPIASYIPELGLSNKGYMKMNEEIKEYNETESISSIPSQLNHIPYEQDLNLGTIWPEDNILYGHKNNIIYITSNNDKSLIASSCTSRDSESGVIILWSSKTNQIYQILSGNSDSVIHISFSHDNKYLLSVSRIRVICLYKIKDDSKYELVYTNNKINRRIIWSCDFSYDDKYVIMCSRDLSFSICEIKDNSLILKSQIYREIPLTSISFCSKMFNDKKYIFSVGYDDGKIEFWSGNEDKYEILCTMNKNDCFIDKINSMLWKSDGSELLVCSNDYSIRLYKIKF